MLGGPRLHQPLSPRPHLGCSEYLSVKTSATGTRGIMPAAPHLPDSTIVLVSVRDEYLQHQDQYN
jgi:hypothetical protein